MKFKFCSDGDCPLWALAALHALGSLPAALFKNLLHHIMEEQPQLFRSVIKEFATILENKSLDNNTNKMKTKAWEEVQKKFNALNGRLRSLTQLKVQWKTMKINARKEVSQFKRATLQTGGGRRPQTPHNDLIEICDILNPAELVRDENIYDSDGIIINASTSASETFTFTLQDNTENINLSENKSDLAVWENKHLGKQEASSMSVDPVVEDHIPAASQKSNASMILQENTANKTQVKNMETTPHTKHIKTQKLKKVRSPSCSAKDDGIMDILKDTNLSSREECARAAAVVRWVVHQACACSCSGTQLTRDLLVLGVPRAHAAALGRAADEHRTEYEARVHATGPLINKLTEVSVASGPEGTLDTYKLILHSDDVLTGDQKKRELIIEKSQASCLLEELKLAYKKMEEIEHE